ncbi:hypothetical protein [Heyndrickxia camelliae]|uniref:Uncharacterized protein n=1 Tax=Heyndrickxia camelliae TaxID=1707093 RepID=A0A2N3LJ66_9BACI|nr:hypothetical protein [Heyndrickxia camelliae]PKR84672.1 hypothetical protein CWO92_13260 [Heyndrickxia camelliae]
MEVFHKFADFLWDGLILKYVSERDIVIPYLLFLIMGVVFELFLLVLAIISAYLLFSFEYMPDISYFASIGILILLFLLNLLMLRAVKNKVKPR